MPLSRRLLAEFLGTALLLACVVGSGIMGVKLSAGTTASRCSPTPAPRPARCTC
jgi:glycerol uptake facilitator-like aquaporin